MNRIGSIFASVIIVSLFALSPLLAQTQGKHHDDKIDRMVKAYLGDERIDIQHAAVAKRTADTLHGKYYIQMGAFARKRPLALLSKLHKSGYATHLRKVTRNAVTVKKLLVGPFSSYRHAREVLPDLQRFVSGAFILR